MKKIYLYHIFVVLSLCSCTHTKISNYQSNCDSLRKEAKDEFLEGNYLAADSICAEAIKCFTEYGDSLAVGKMIANRGSIASTRGFFYNAMDFNQKAGEIFERLNDDSSQVRLLVVNGTLYFHNKNYKKSKELFYLAMKKYKKGSNLEAPYMNCHIYLGQILDSEGDSIEAIKILQKGLKIAQEIKSDKFEGTILRCIGETYYDQMKYDSSYMYLKKSFDIASKLDDMVMFSDIYYYFGKLYHKWHSYKFAEENVKKAIAIYKQKANLTRLDDCYRTLSDIAEDQNKHKLALAYRDTFEFFADSTSKIKNTQAFAEMQTKYESDKKEIENERLKETHKNTMYFFLTICGAGFFILCVVSISYRKLSKKNKLISEKKDQIVVQNKELHLLYTENVKQKGILQIQKDELHHQNEKISDSIQYAQLIQQAILPPPDIFLNYYSDYFILYKPKEKVSGDFYWVTCNGEDEEHLYFAVVDCTGHGVPGAMMSMLCCAFLDQSLQEGNNAPSSILNFLDRQISNRLRSKNNGSDEEKKGVVDGMELTVIKYSKTKKIMEYGGAGHAFYLIRDGEIQTLKTEKKSIGNADHEPYQTFEKELMEGDIIYLFSDGYKDQMNSQGKKFMSKQFQNKLLDISPKPAKEQREILNETFENWKGEHEQLDDVTVLGIRV